MRNPTDGISLTDKGRRLVEAKKAVEQGLILTAEQIEVLAEYEALCAADLPTPEHHEAYRVIFDDLRMCGCGNPEDVLALVRTILSLHPLYDHRQEINQLLPDDAVQDALLYWLNGAELTTHGGIVSGGWLTEKGERFLAALRTLDHEEILEAGYEIVEA